MTRKQWFNLHSWAGLQFSLLLCFILVTGTLATISRDIDWLVNPAMRATENVSVNNVNWSGMFYEADRNCNHCQLLKMEVSEDSWFNAETIALDNAEQRFRIFHDRASGYVTGTGLWMNVHQFIRQLHRHLMLPKQLGITIVCLMVIPLLIALVSSLIFYRHWYRYLFKWPTFSLGKDGKRDPTKLKNRQRRKLWGELHKFIGSWSIAFMVLIVITGSWYLAEIWGLKADYPREIPKTYHKDHQPTLTANRLEELLVIARKTFPTLDIYAVKLPTTKYPYLVLEGQAEATLVRNKANQIVLDIDTGDILSVRHGDELGIHARISEAADPLHFGNLGGGITRWIWFIFGVMLSGVMITGVYLWANRTLSQLMSDKPSYFNHIWLAMGWMRWPIMGLLTSCLSLAILNFYP